MPDPVPGRADRADRSRSALASVLSRTALLRFAGEASFERGERYAADGSVSALVEDAGVVAARVRGTSLYRVRLWVEGSGGGGSVLGFSCTCPVGADGACCKHCVATGLVWLARSEGAGREGAGGGGSHDPAVTMDDVRAHLARQPKESLVELLVAQAMGDDRLRRRLCLEVVRTQATPTGAGAVAGAPSVASLRMWIDEAAQIDDFLDYDEVVDYAAGIDDVVDSLEALLEDGHAGPVLELVGHAIEVVEAARSYVDDSSGYVGGVLERLAELHLAACEQADLDPVELAEQLFARELNGESETFYGALDTYAEVLGPQGLAAYRKVAEAEWDRVPARDRGASYAFDHRRIRVTRMMETLARLEDDVEALVAVKRRDLSHAYAYLEIAEAYREAGQDEDALAWAERGMGAFPEPAADGRLRAFLAEEYHRRGRHDDAVGLLWQAFSGSPGLARYQELRAHAGRAGRWPAWRERALARLREHVAATRRSHATARFAQWSVADHSELVRVFLWEGEVEAAWTEARAGGCADALWLELADKRAGGHPEEVLPVYERAIEQTLAHTGNDVYERAVGLLRKVQEVLRRLGREAEFAGRVASIRTAQRRKRNLMKLLDAAGW